MEYDPTHNLFIDYQIKENDAWISVTKQEWIREERNAGFKPKGVTDAWKDTTTCATAGFSTTQNNRSGRQVYMFHIPTAKNSYHEEQKPYIGVETNIEYDRINKGFEWGMRYMFDMMNKIDKLEDMFPGLKPEAIMRLKQIAKENVAKQVLELNDNS